MLVGRIKTESVLEFVHHFLDMYLGDPFQNLVIGLGLFYTLEISSEEVIWSRRLLDS